MISFCSRPFTDINIESTGFITPCCYIHTTRIGQSNFQNKKLKNYLTSSGLNSLKLLNGEKPGECAHCWRAEESGLKSFRKTTFLGNSKIRELHVKSSSVCNFMCRMCGPFNSSTWQAVGIYILSLYQLYFYFQIRLRLD